MTPSLLGINYSIDHTAEPDKRDKFHAALAPAYSVAMVDSAKDKARIFDEQFIFKETTIIGRIWHPMQGGFHLKPTGAGDENKEFVASPEDVANEMGDLGISGKSWAYVLNEPMGNGDPANLDRLAKWLTLWMDKSIPQKRRSVMFNWGDREPAIENGMWQTRWHGHLKRMALHPELFCVGMHFYGPDDLTLHLAAYVKTCEHLGITPIPVIATEFGVDTDAGSATNGYHSRGWDGNKMGQWIEGAITGDLAPFIRSGVLVGLCLFTWSNQPDWSAFDISRDLTLQSHLLDAKQRGIFDPPAPKKTTTTVPIVKLFPSDFATRSIERWVKGKSTAQYIRKYPYVAAERLYVLDTIGSRCDIIPSHALRLEETVVETINGRTGTWIPIKCNSYEGFMWDGDIVVTVIPDRVATSENPVAEPVLPFPAVPAPMPPIIPMATLPLSALKAMKENLLAQIAILDLYIQKETVIVQ